MRIIYMGTPDFAVGPLRSLLEAHYDIVAVVTMPDKAVGRHHDVLSASAVKRFALERGIPVLQPERLKDEAFLAELRSYRADLQIVVAFRMLPEVVWAMPRLGTFNLHAALLPQYRGAAPINWAIINGERETGVTTFFLDHEIDTGRIILQERCPIRETDNVEDVHDRLMELGSRVVLRTVALIERGEATSTPQEQFMSDEPLRPAPKIFKETCRIDWSRTPRDVYNFIRGLAPYPGAWTEMVGPDGRRQVVKIYGAVKPPKPPKGGCTNRTPHSHIPPWGAWGAIPVNALLDGSAALRITELQVAGKRRMSADDFLRGAHLSPDTYFE